MNEHRHAGERLLYVPCQSPDNMGFVYIDLIDTQKDLLDPFKIDCLIKHTLNARKSGVLMSTQYTTYSKWWLKNRDPEREPNWNVRKSPVSLGSVKTWTVFKPFEPWHEEMGQLLARVESAGIQLKTLARPAFFDTSKNFHKRGTVSTRSPT